jgi:PBP1b-binding outer membrane lipoprotein LpoB
MKKAFVVITITLILSSCSAMNQTYVYNAKNKKEKCKVENHKTSGSLIF